ncbi:MAG: hypothetical protein ACFB10_16850 [Salibacteraceae bacterium]
MSHVNSGKKLKNQGWITALIRLGAIGLLLVVLLVLIALGT